MFLRQAWKLVVPAKDASWIDTVIASAKERPSEPGAGAGAALEQLLTTGASRKDIHEVVRVMQYELLSSLCYLLDDPGELEPEIEDMAWQLMRVDEDGECISAIGSLHESVLETEPSQSEMRPKAG